MRRILFLVLALGLVGALALPAQAAPARTRLVSKTSGGDPANEDSTESSISATGRYIVFQSEADNLPGDDTFTNSYIHDRRTGNTRLISKNSQGDPVVDGDADDPTVSGSGRYVAFESDGSNLPGANGFVQIYIHDRQTGRTRLVSKNNAGDPADDNCDDAAISLSGRYVAFESQGDNFPGDDLYDNVYVRDLERGRTVLVSKTSGGVPVDGDTFDPAISGSGRLVVFETSAPNLGASSSDQIGVHDRKTGKTRVASRTSGGDLADGDTDDPNISPDGRFVVFNTTAENLGSDGSLDQVVIHDRKNKTTRLVSRNSAGDVATDGDSEDGVVTGPGGRYVAFESDATNLPKENGFLQIYVRDRLRNRTRIVSVNNAGEPAESDCSGCLHRGQRVMSLDGTFITFELFTPDFPGDPNYEDIYVRGPLHR